MLRYLFSNVLSEKAISANAPAFQRLAKRFNQKRKMRRIPLWQGDVIEVEYCLEEDYKGHYLILKERLCKDFPRLIEVRGNPHGLPRRGAFEVLWRRGNELQEELWSKFSSGEPRAKDATHGVADVISYDLKQILKKYGEHRGRFIFDFPKDFEEMDYYKELHQEKWSAVPNMIKRGERRKNVRWNETSFIRE